VMIDLERRNVDEKGVELMMMMTKME